MRAARHASATIAAMLNKPRILVVEDESGIADTLQYVLSTDGFAPVWCSTAGQALREFAAELPALVILDVGLPDLNGFELFKRLQALPGGAQVPMLFLTARSDEIDRVVGLELGADDYIAKPFSPRELVARVRGILRRSVRPPRCATARAAASARRHALAAHRARRHAVRARRGAPPDPLLRPGAGAVALRIRHPAPAGAQARPRLHARRAVRPGVGRMAAAAWTARWTRTSRPCAPSSRPWRRTPSRSAPRAARATR